jgi:hypothetical protein
MSNISNIRFTIGGVDYEWSGRQYGAIIKSYERGLKRGDVRVIAGRMFYVAYLWEPFRTIPLSFKKEVCWTLPNVTIESIQSFKCELFGTLPPLYEYNTDDDIPLRV